MALAAVTAAAIQPPDNLAVLAALWDKGVHAAGYAVVGLLALRATHDGFGPLRSGPLALAALIAVGHGGAVEILQKFISWRQASFGDLAADAVGFSVAAAAFGAWSALRRGRAPVTREGS